MKIKLKIIIFVTILLITAFVSCLIVNYKNRLEPITTCESNYDYSDKSIIKLLELDLESCNYYIIVKHLEKEINLSKDESHYLIKQFTVDINKYINVSSDFKYSDTYFFEIYNSKENELLAYFEIYSGEIIKMNNDYKYMDNTKKINKFLKQII